MRIALVHRSDKLHREDGAFIAALRRRFEVSSFDVARGLPARAQEVAGLEDAEACVWMVRFRDLPAHGSFDWQGYEGLRVLLDWDAWSNFWSLSHTRLLGVYSTEFRRHRFDLMVCSSTPTAERFADEGIAAAVLFKGYDAATLRPLGEPRQGLGTFGFPYPSRRAAEGTLARAGLAPRRFSAPFDELNDHLNGFEAVLVCNMVGLPRRGGAQLERLRPGWGVRGMGEGPEVMLKSFEVAGSGATLLTDRAADLEELGYVHGATALVYRDLADLVEVWRHWSGNHDALASIGAAGAELARTRHTWEHRATELEQVLATALAEG